ncbi:MAG: hypothetical protein GX605_12945 [Chloroflexi bacterium]|nr:hypothetical protein [Chloroflexota bacterium]
MTLVLALAGCLGEAAIVYAILILRQLSEKLGSVTKMRPYYRGYYVAIALLGVALLSRLVHIGTVLGGTTQSVSFLGEEAFYLLTHHLPLALGISVALGITIKYWGWLLRE